MILEYLAHDRLVQLGFLVGLTAIILAAMAARRSKQSEELKSQDQRQKDLLPISQRIANHKAREKDAGHQLARDF